MTEQIVQENHHLTADVIYSFLNCVLYGMDYLLTLDSPTFDTFKCCVKSNTVHCC